MIISRPSTREATEQRSRLQSRERASRGGSRYIFIDEADKTPDPTPTQEELDIEREILIERERLDRERLDREREERAMRLKDELEQSLDTNDAIRMRRKQLAEVYIIMSLVADLRFCFEILLNIIIKCAVHVETV